MKKFQHDRKGWVVHADGSTTVTFATPLDAQNALAAVIMEYESAAHRLSAVRSVSDMFTEEALSYNVVMEALARLNHS